MLPENERITESFKIIQTKKVRKDPLNWYLVKDDKNNKCWFRATKDSNGILFYEPIADQTSNNGPVGSTPYYYYKELSNKHDEELNDLFFNLFDKKENKLEFEMIEENLNEVKFKDKVKAIKKSLKKNDKRLSDKTAQKSAERIAGSMIKNENKEDINELEVLANDIIDFMGADMGTWFDEIQGNEEEIFYETLAILENKDKNQINILIDNIQEADIDEEIAEEVNIKSSKNLVKRLKELLKDKKTEGIINPPEIQQEISIQDSEDVKELDILSNLQERIGQQMEVGRFNALLQNIFNMYNRTFILPTDLYNMDLDSTQEIVITDDIDGELREYSVFYEIIDIDEGLIQLIDVKLN